MQVADSEIVGLVPRNALPTSGIDRLKLINFSSDKILEDRIAELKVGKMS